MRVVAIPSAVLLAEFDRRVAELNAVRNRAEALLADGHFDGEALEITYAGVYLSFMAEFERLLERLFFGLASGDISCGTGVVLRIPATSPVVCELLLIGKQYLDWLPYDLTIERARVLSYDGKPFTLATEQERGVVGSATLIRNAIAHKTRNAMEKFTDKVLGSGKVTTSERTPIGYLRGQYRSSPKQTRIENIVEQMQVMAKRICS